MTVKLYGDMPGLEQSKGEEKTFGRATSTPLVQVEILEVEEWISAEGDYFKRSKRAIIRGAPEHVRPFVKEAEYGSFGRSGGLEYETPRVPLKPSPPNSPVSAPEEQMVARFHEILDLKDSRELTEREAKELEAIKAEFRRIEASGWDPPLEAPDWQVEEDLDTLMRKHELAMQELDELHRFLDELRAARVSSESAVSSVPKRSLE